MSTRPRYSADSVARALVHHGVRHRRPVGPRDGWLVWTDTGTHRLTTREAWAYALGLADGHRRAPEPVHELTPEEAVLMVKAASARRIER